MASAPGALVGGETGVRPGQELQNLVTAFWNGEMRRDPFEATLTGDHRYDDRLPDPSEVAHRAEVDRLRTLRTRLVGIDRARLSQEERIEREVLASVLDDRIAGAAFAAHLTPINHRGGLPRELAECARYHPCHTAGDLENYLRRLQGFPHAVDALIAVMRRGMAEGRVSPCAIMAQVPAQLRAFGVPRPEDSPFWPILTQFPDDWSESNRNGSAAKLRVVIERDVAPAFRRLATFVECEYLPSCRASIGLWDTPDGRAHYAHLARSYTTTDLTPDEIHAIGLAEVAKDRAAMEVIVRKVGFTGDLKSFLTNLGTDPKRRCRTEEGMLDSYRAILRAMDERLPRLFGRLPQTNLVVKPVEPCLASTSGAGFYTSAPADGARPAYFSVNTADPTSHTIYTMETLAYHEGVPGHHIQLSLAHEAPGRSMFRRHVYFPAFSEGWALYAEGLPAEVGLDTDPYVEFGRLEASAWRSARLVVDTGIHHLHWTRDQAIAYLEAISADPHAQVEAEVDRYIARPGQALAYKIGELKIREVRAAAERRSGKTFDIRAFHDRLLAQGALPFKILERLMNDEMTE